MAGTAADDGGDTPTIALVTTRSCSHRTARFFRSRGAHVARMGCDIIPPTAPRAPSPTRTSPQLFADRSMVTLSIGAALRLPAVEEQEALPGVNGRSAGGFLDAGRLQRATIRAAHLPSSSPPPSVRPSFPSGPAASRLPCVQPSRLLQCAADVSAGVGLPLQSGGPGERVHAPPHRGGIVSAVAAGSLDEPSSRQLSG